MTTNVGTIDRLFRLVLGVILLVAPLISGLAMFNSTVAVVVSILAGLVLIATAVMKTCPLYTVFGIRTCKS